MLKSKKSNYQIEIVAMTNILITIIDKVYLLSVGASGPPVVVPILLWYFIFKRRRWAYLTYTILAVIISLLGILSIWLTFMYILRGFNPTSPIFMVVLGGDYLISWIILRAKIKKM